MLDIFIRYSRGRTARYFSTNRTAKIITALLFLLVLGFFALEMFFLFRFGFGRIAKDVFFGEALLLYTIELFFLATFILVAASALISGIFTLFRSEDDEYLLASPRFRSKISIAYWRMSMLSSWPIVLLVIPALLALGAVFHLNAFGAILAVIGVMLMTALAVASALFFILVVARILSALSDTLREPLLSKFTLSLCTVGTFGVLTYVLYGYFRSENLVRFFEARKIDITKFDIAPIIEKFQFLPSHPAALLVTNSVSGNITASLMSFLALCVLLFVMLAMLMFAARWFLNSAQVLAERDRRRSFLGVDLVPTDLFRRMEGGLAALSIKELSVFLRDGRGLMWLFFVLLIWLFQVGSTSILAHNLEDERVSAGLGVGVLEAIAFATIVYFASIIILRFVFPAFSAERKTSWLLRGAPIDLFRSYTAKLVVFFVVVGILGSFFAVMDLAAAGIALFPSGIVLLSLALLAVFFLTSYGLSLGAMFPNTETDDPELLSTTLPGLAFIGGSLAYGLLGALALRHLLSTGEMFPVASFILASLIFPIVLAHRSRTSLMRPVE